MTVRARRLDQYEPEAATAVLLSAESRPLRRHLRPLVWTEHTAQQGRRHLECTRSPQAKKAGPCRLRQRHHRRKTAPPRLRGSPSPPCKSPARGCSTWMGASHGGRRGCQPGGLASDRVALSIFPLKLQGYQVAHNRYSVTFRAVGRLGSDDIPEWPKRRTAGFTTPMPVSRLSLALGSLYSYEDVLADPSVVIDRLEHAGVKVGPPQRPGRIHPHGPQRVGQSSSRCQPRPPPAGAVEATNALRRHGQSRRPASTQSPGGTRRQKRSSTRNQPCGRRW
jgi:hypothetical protein